jgi:hypothetical protein
MKKLIYTLNLLLVSIGWSYGQTNPAITSWLQNTSAKGTYYTSGNSTAISNGILVGCQSVKYSDNNVYISTNGIPFHPVGPYLDGNISQAGAQNAIFKFPLSPQQNTGTLTSTGMGNVGVFIDGTAMFNSKDGVSWKNSSNAFAGGPTGGQGDGVWNRDAIVYEKGGFDCSKGHPAGTNYHHHQNPTAFKADKNIISSICNLYDADGLYLIDTTKHSPLIGFAYDGFPVYGAYGYKNANGTGGFVRIKSGYQLRNISVRTHHADGTDVTDGPAVSGTHPLGSFIEDYEWMAHAGEQDYLDKQNGRFCVTPEYPNGTYAYFATVDANYNSYYPYLIGPSFYGVWANRKVSSINETTTTYTPVQTSISKKELENLSITVFPNPASDLIVVQLGDLVKFDMKVELFDFTGKLVASSKINKGTTLAYFDAQTLYEGTYLVRISDGNEQIVRKIIIKR